MVCLLLTALPSLAQVQLEKQNNAFSVSGPGWRLTYGGTNNFSDVRILESGGRIWLAHGPWLRVIDPRTGEVRKRWHLNAGIVQLSEAKGAVVATTGEPPGPRFFNGPARATVAVN